MRTMTAVAAGILVGVAALAGGRAFASLQDKPAAGAVAFVDVKKVMLEHPKYREFEDRLRSESDKLREELQGRDAEILKRRQDVEARLSPGTPPYEAEMKRIEMARMELKFDKESGNARLERRGVLDLASVYQDVRQEAERIASERGFAAVLDINTDPLRVEENGRVRSMTELQLVMGMRTAIWAREDVDLTKAVIEAVKPAAPPEKGK